MRCPHCGEEIDRIYHSNLNCWCQECNPHAWWMIVCRDCGNKRCPKATHHAHACTRSNEPGQVGSAYGELCPEDCCERARREQILYELGE